MVIHILVNGGLKVMPPVDLESAELRAYLSDEASTWAIVHGLRNLIMKGTSRVADNQVDAVSPFDQPLGNDQHDLLHAAAAVKWV